MRRDAERPAYIQECRRKIVYRTLTEARQAVERMKEKHGTAFHWYACRFGAHWHVAGGA